MNTRLIIICFLGTLYHAAFLGLNDILKVADSFAYLQMSHYLGDFSQKGLGNGWFGFVYSLPIAIVEFFIGNDFLAGKIVNLILINISTVLLYILARKVLSINFALLTISLFFLSPTLLHFNIHILSENIYIPLFLGLLLLVLQFVSLAKNTTLQKQSSYTIAIACMIGLMYLTRAEAFIYMGSIGLISLYLLVKGQINTKRFFTLGAMFFLSFFLFISPYLLHLHSMTGQWGLTNKGASNLRQAELRGTQKMDDAGFEQAVAELTDDKSQLIAGFAGGMNYVKPQIEGSLGAFIKKDPAGFARRVFTNQLKLFQRNIPEIFIGKAPKLYFSDDARFSHIAFLLFSLFPLVILIYGSSKMFMRHKEISLTMICFFLPAMVFFTLFFTLNRYFLIFLPLMFIVFSYGISELMSKSSHIKKYLGAFALCNFISISLLSTLVYYNTESRKDEYYALKKKAGVWLSENKTNSENLKIMERFPIVTYYSGSKTRYITPYTDKISDISRYAQINDLDILVVDSMDFLRYRPGLKKYLGETPTGFELTKSFTNEKNQTVILYSPKR